MNNHYKFINLPLPYPYDAMEPYIDKKTMHLHHDKHLQTYIDNLNSALEKYPQFQTWSLEQLLMNVPSTESGRLGTCLLSETLQSESRLH